MDELISKIETLSRRPRVPSDPTGAIDVGEALWGEVRLLATDVEREALIVAWARIITTAVNGFSDYQDCFWQTEYFFELAISYAVSTSTALECIKACHVMWQSHDVSEHFTPGWANAAIIRAIEWLRVPRGGHEQLDTARVADIIGGCKILKAVAKAGREYEELMLKHAVLSDAISESMHCVEEACSEGRQLTHVLEQLLAVKAMCAATAANVLTALEQSVNLRRPSSDCLLNAYNAMCDQRPEDLELQVRASQGPLVTLALHILTTRNEGTGLDANGEPVRNKQLPGGSKSVKRDDGCSRGADDHPDLDVHGGVVSGEEAAEVVDEGDDDDDDDDHDFDGEEDEDSDDSPDEIFLEACVFIKFLLEPWERDDASHMTRKTQIATTLLELGALEGLLSQLSFWALQWDGYYGDAGDSCLIALLELMRYFPDIVKKAVTSRPEVVEMIRQQAANGRVYKERFSGRAFRLAREKEFETGLGAAMKLENLLDGKSEDGEPFLAEAGANRNADREISADTTGSGDRSETEGLFVDAASTAVAASMTRDA
jgi:hypothetical protein